MDESSDPRDCGSVSDTHVVYDNTDSEFNKIRQLHQEM